MSSTRASGRLLAAIHGRLSLAGLGYRQGAIRVAMSFLGILFGYWLAGPLSGPLTLLMKPLGVKSPIMLWLLPPLIAFCVVNALFKIGAMAGPRLTLFAACHHFGQRYADVFLELLRTFLLQLEHFQQFATQPSHRRTFLVERELLSDRSLRLLDIVDQRLDVVARQHLPPVVL